MYVRFDIFLISVLATVHSATSAKIALFSFARLLNYNYTAIYIENILCRVICISYISVTRFTLLEISSKSVRHGIVESAHARLRSVARVVYVTGVRFVFWNVMAGKSGLPRPSASRRVVALGLCAGMIF